MTIDLLRQIKLFDQKEKETFAQVLELFLDLFLTCSYHSFEKWRIISFFYDTLDLKMKKLVKTMCQGEFLNKKEKEAEAYLEWLAKHDPK